jgi:hypothetical protein
MEWIRAGKRDLESNLSMRLVLIVENSPDIERMSPPQTKLFKLDPVGDSRSRS